MSYFAKSDQLPAWIGRPPEGWRANWFKWHVGHFTDRPTEDEIADLPYISNEDIESWTGRLLKEDPQPVEADGRKFKENDVLFNKLRPYLAKIYHAAFDGISSGELLCLRPSSEVLPRFLYYVVSSKAFVDSINAETFGSKMPRADWETVGHQPLPLPPFDVQQRIAQFLDQKTAQIDALIAKKRALLDRLAEKRQALITRAVTKGLNPDAPMKSSGIDWLGDIPAHWEVKRLKSVVQDAVGLQMGPFGGMLTDLPTDQTGFKLYGQENTISGDFSRGNRWVEEERYNLLYRYRLLPGDLVITRKGSLGNCRRVPPDALPGIADSDTIRIRFDESAMKSALALLLLHDAQYVASQIEADRRGAILSGLNTGTVGGIWLAVPPLIEQEKILDACSDIVKRLDNAAKTVADSVDKLVEYRSALITAAVTGKLRDLQ